MVCFLNKNFNNIHQFFLIRLGMPNGISWFLRWAASLLNIQDLNHNEAMILDRAIDMIEEILIFYIHIYFNVANKIL